MSGTPSIDALAQPGIGIKPLQSLKKHRRISVLVWFLVILLGLPLVFIKGKSTYHVESVFHVAPRYMKNLQSDAEVELQSNSQYREYVNQLSQTVLRYDVLPDGHPKLLHVWPVKLLQAGRTDYEGSDVMAMRAAASLSR